MKVCVAHGGAIPHVRAAAERRLAAMAWASLDVFDKALGDYALEPGLAIRVAMDVLDRNGFRAAQQVQSDGKLTIEVEYVGQQAKPLVIEAKPQGRPLIEFLPEALEE